MCTQNGPSRLYHTWLCLSLRKAHHAVTPPSPPASPEAFHLQRQFHFSLLPPASWQPQICFVSHELDHAMFIPVCLADFTTARLVVGLVSEMCCRYHSPKPQLSQTFSCRTDLSIMNITGCDLCLTILSEAGLFPISLIIVCFPVVSCPLICVLCPGYAFSSLATCPLESQIRGTWDV